jgi:predicted AAA+ superfamily ATPase
MPLIARHLAAKVARCRTLKTSRVINIAGPRQTGQTTLVRDTLHVGLDCGERTTRTFWLKLNTGWR